MPDIANPADAVVDESATHRQKYRRCPLAARKAGR
jgi:hypothetical protein